MGKSAGKLESSQKQNCNILTQLSGICRVLGGRDEVLEESGRSDKAR